MYSQDKGKIIFNWNRTYLPDFAHHLSDHIFFHGKGLLAGCAHLRNPAHVVNNLSVSYLTERPFTDWANLPDFADSDNDQSCFRKWSLSEGAHLLNSAHSVNDLSCFWSCKRLLTGWALLPEFAVSLNNLSCQFSMQRSLTKLACLLTLARSGTNLSSDRKRTLIEWAYLLNCTNLLTADLFIGKISIFLILQIQSLFHLMIEKGHDMNQVFGLILLYQEIHDYLYSDPSASRPGETISGESVDWDPWVWRHSSNRGPWPKRNQGPDFALDGIFPCYCLLLDADTWVQIGYSAIFTPSMVQFVVGW